MDKNLEELKFGVDYVFKDTSFPGRKEAAYALIELWTTLRKKGIEPRDFARAALLVSDCMMTCYETLPEVLRFAERMEATAKDKLDTLRKHWPNIRNDEAVWPKGLHPKEKD